MYFYLKNEEFRPTNVTTLKDELAQFHRPTQDTQATLLYQKLYERNALGRDYTDLTECHHSLKNLPFKIFHNWVI